jgi:hypothetical protein
MALLNREDMSREIRSLRYRAEEVRTMVESMHDPNSRRSLLLIAASYEAMADRLEATAAHLLLGKAG